MRRRACNHVAVQCHLGIDGGWVLENSDVFQTHPRKRARGEFDRDWLAALVIFRGLGVDRVASFLQLLRSCLQEFWVIPDP